MNLELGDSVDIPEVLFDSGLDDEDIREFNTVWKFLQRGGRWEE